MKKVFVTGGSGFIGTNLMELLGQRGIEAVNYDCRAPRNPAQAGLHIEGNLLDGDRLRRAIADFAPETIIHLAARTDLDGSQLEDYAANMQGVVNLIAAVREQSTVNRVVFTSSRYVHANAARPAREDEYSYFTLYGHSKAEGEKIVRGSGLGCSWVIIRPTSIWGPWFDVPYKTFFETLYRGAYIHPRGRRILKTYGYVGNVVHEIAAMAEADAAAVHGRTLYVADYEPLEVLAWGNSIRSAFGLTPVREMPMAVFRLLAAAGDTLKLVGYKHPPLTSFRLHNLLEEMPYDIHDTEEVVGPLPFTQAEGVRRTVDWMIEHDHLHREAK